MHRGREFCGFGAGRPAPTTGIVSWANAPRTYTLPASVLLASKADAVSANAPPPPQVVPAPQRAPDTHELDPATLPGDALISKVPPDMLEPAERKKAKKPATKGKGKGTGKGRGAAAKRAPAKATTVIRRKRAATKKAAAAMVDDDFSDDDHAMAAYARHTPYGGGGGGYGYDYGYGAPDLYRAAQSGRGIGMHGYGWRDHAADDAYPIPPAAMTDAFGGNDPYSWGLTGGGDEDEYERVMSATRDPVWALHNRGLQYGGGFWDDEKQQVVDIKARIKLWQNDTPTEDERSLIERMDILANTLMSINDDIINNRNVWSNLRNDQRAERHAARNRQTVLKERAEAAWAEIDHAYNRLKSLGGEKNEQQEAAAQGELTVDDGIPPPADASAPEDVEPAARAASDASADAHNDEEVSQAAIPPLEPATSPPQHIPPSIPMSPEEVHRQRTAVRRAAAERSAERSAISAERFAARMVPAVRARAAAAVAAARAAAEDRRQKARDVAAVHAEQEATTRLDKSNAWLREKHNAHQYHMQRAADDAREGARGARSHFSLYYPTRTQMRAPSYTAAARVHAYARANRARLYQKTPWLARLGKSVYGVYRPTIKQVSLADTSGRMVGFGARVPAGREPDMHALERAMLYHTVAGSDINAMGRTLARHWVRHYADDHSNVWSPRGASVLGRIHPQAVATIQHMRMHDGSGFEPIHGNAAADVARALSRLAPNPAHLFMGHARAALGSGMSPRAVAALRKPEVMMGAGMGARTRLVAAALDRMDDDAPALLPHADRMTDMDLRPYNVPMSGGGAGGADSRADRTERAARREREAEAARAVRRDTSPRDQGPASSGHINQSTEKSPT